jgi:hypothetical protein
MWSNPGCVVPRARAAMVPLEEPRGRLEQAAQPGPGHPRPAEQQARQKARPMKARVGLQALLSWEHPKKMERQARSTMAQAALRAARLRVAHPSRSQPGRALPQPAARHPTRAMGADSSLPLRALRVARARRGAIPRSARAALPPGAVARLEPGGAAEAPEGSAALRAGVRSMPAWQGPARPSWALLAVVPALRAERAAARKVAAAAARPRSARRRQARRRRRARPTQVPAQQALEARPMETPRSPGPAVRARTPIGPSLARTPVEPSQLVRQGSGRALQPVAPTWLRFPRVGIESAPADDAAMPAGRAAPPSFA